MLVIYFANQCVHMFCKIRMSTYFTYVRLKWIDQSFLQQVIISIFKILLVSFNYFHLYIIARVP